MLGSEFREQPRSVDVAVGSDVVLGCRAPRGEPEPRVRWRKDGDPVRPDERRVTVSDTGTLRIRDAATADSGVYVCIAFNIGGEKETAPARLTVRGASVVIGASILAPNNSSTHTHTHTHTMPASAGATAGMSPLPGGR